MAVVEPKGVGAVREEERSQDFLLQVELGTQKRPPLLWRGSNAVVVDMMPLLAG